MHPPVSAEKKEAMRELRECLPPTFPRLATIAGIHVTTLREIASRENWGKLHAPHGTIMQPVRLKDREAEEARLARAEALAALEDPEEDVPPGDVAALVVAELRSILGEVRVGLIDKNRIDALLTLLKAAERVDNLPPELGNNPWGQQEQRSDEQLADILARVDRRIVELARDYAERLVAGELAGE